MQNNRTGNGTMALCDSYSGSHCIARSLQNEYALHCCSIINCIAILYNNTLIPNSGTVWQNIIVIKRRKIELRTFSSWGNSSTAIITCNKGVCVRAVCSDTFPFYGMCSLHSYGALGEGEHKGMGFNAVWVWVRLRDFLSFFIYLFFERRGDR